MTVYYLDLKNGNDNNDGTSFANRKKTLNSFGSTPTGGDEIRIAGQPSTLVDATAKINNCNGDTYQNRNCSFTFSTTTGETSVSYSNHGMQTGDLVRIWNNSSHSTEDERPNGVWTVTRVDNNNFKLNGYTAPATGSGNGYLRYCKGSQITLTNAVVKNVACYNQTGNWTASTNVTTELATSTGYWSTNTRIKSRNYSNKISIGADFTTGKAAYFATGTLDLSGYQQISFWVGQDSGTRSQPQSPNVSLHLCTDTQGDVGVHSMAIYTGQDSLTNDGFWRVMKKDFETNLNSSIQSVALYVDSDSGAQNFYIDNVIASKAASANDSITLSSIVGLKTSTDWPNYYLINSIINENIIHLEGAGESGYSNRHPVGYYSAEMNYWAGIGISFYNGGTQTVPIYKIEPLRLKEDMGVDPQNSSSTAYNATYFTNNMSGISTTNRITFSGGWDASNNMATQYDGGYTAVDGINNRNAVWYLRSQYADYSNLIGVNGYYSMYINSSNYSSFDHVAGIGGYYAFYFNNNDYYRNMYVWGTHGRSRCIEFSYNDTAQSDGSNDYNVGYARTMFAFGSSYPMYASYVKYGGNSWDRIEVYGGYNYGAYFYECWGMDMKYYRGGRWPAGGANPTALYTQRCSGMQIGIVSCTEMYYLWRNSQADLSCNYFYEVKHPYNQSEGGNGRSNNTYYALYTENSGPIKVISGGITTSRYYVNQAPLYLNNVVDNYTSSHQINTGQVIYSKNHDGVSGAILNQYQYGTVEKETSIRHTASGVSWKIDISNSQASSGTPIEWLLTKLIVNANAAVTVKIWVYRDGTGVNGGLRLKAGSIAGVTANVDAVITDTTINSWVECSLTFTPTEAGAVDIFAMGYHVNNTSHNVYLDDFSASQA